MVVVKAALWYCPAMSTKRDTESIRVNRSVRWHLKVAAAELDVTIARLLALVEQGDRAALRTWQRKARELGDG